MIVPILRFGKTLGIVLIIYCYKTNHPQISSWKQQPILLSLLDLLVDWDQLGHSSAGFTQGLSPDWLQSDGAWGRVIWKLKAQLSGTSKMASFITNGASQGSSHGLSPHGSSLSRACPLFLFFWQNSLQGVSRLPWACFQRLNLLMSQAWEPHSVICTAFYWSSRAQVIPVPRRGKETINTS